MRALVSLASMLALLPVSFACAQSAQSAQGPVYAVDYSRLYSVNPDTRQATRIGTESYNGSDLIGDLSGLTTAPDGTLYAASDTLKALVTINPGTGHASVIGSFNISPSQTGLASEAPLDFGMAYGCSGKLWLSSTTAGKLWQVDPGTGKTTLVGALGHTISGLTVRGGELLGAGARDDENLYSINTGSGQATVIGGYGSAIPYSASMSPAVDAKGNLLAAVNYVPPPSGITVVPDWSDLARIDPATGVATIVGTIEGPGSLQKIGIRGLTFGSPDCSPRSDVHDQPPPQPTAAIGVPTTGFGAALLEWLALAAVAMTALLRRR